MVEQVAFWQLLRDWCEEEKNGWSVREYVGNGLHPLSLPPLKYALVKDAWEFRIGDDYVAGYPSCGDNLIAADPEFFEKLSDRLGHVHGCTKCRMILILSKQPLDDAIRQSFCVSDVSLAAIKPANNLQSHHRMFSSHNGAMIPYQTIKISTDP